MNAIKKIYNTAKFYFVNYLFTLKINYISPDVIDGIECRGYEKKDVSAVREVYSKLNYKLGFKEVLANLIGSRCLIVAVKLNEKNEKYVVGINLYYLNTRDLKDGTIHEGFIGVLPEHEGQGIATKMRRHAITHFRKAGFSGLSTRISKNNLRSLLSADKLGFKIVDKYFDLAKNEYRYYLVLKFKNDCN